MEILDAGFAPEPGSDGGREYRLYGPPGCGKSTHVQRQIVNATKKYTPSEILVTSFSRAAAAELSGRGLPLPRENVGTLHAICYRSLGRPPIAEAHIPAWNRDSPAFRLSLFDSDVNEINEIGLNTGTGDQLYGELQVLRASLKPPQLWPERVRRFAKRWEAWKAYQHLLDFTDLLETARRELRIAPGDPRALFVDEAQDLNLLQFSLVHQWGKHVDFMVTAADDDQTIYTFAGAAPEVLLAVEPYWKTVLKQSHRVPRSIHELSQVWIEKVALREPKPFRPREEEGEVRILHRGSYKYPEPIVDDAGRYIADGRTVMFLATCGFFLDPLKAVLRKRGVPFHNPYRLNRADWNPLLQREVGDGTREMSAANQLRSFLTACDHAQKGIWIGRDLRVLTRGLRDGVLLPGAMEIIKQLPESAEVRSVLPRILETTALAELIRLMREAPTNEAIDWWMSQLKPARRRAVAYPERVVKRCGPKALWDSPQVIVGTGHSVKGGEADVVYLLPDLSRSGGQNWEGRRPERDAIVRLGYVMMTRARESLVICEAASSASMPVDAVASRISRQAARRRADTGIRIVN